MYTYIHVFPQLCLLVYNPVDYRYVYHKPQHCKSWDYNVNGHDSGTEKMEVPIPYIFGLFLRPKFQGISPQFIWPEIWY